MSVYVHMPNVRGIPWMLELYAAISCLMWVLGFEPAFSRTSTHNYTAIFSVPRNFLTYIYNFNIVGLGK